MKIKLKDLAKAMDHLKYNARFEDNQELEISMKEEDLDQQNLIGCLTISTSGESKNSYDKVPRTIQVVLDIFPTHENRPLRVSTTETKELID